MNSSYRWKNIMKAQPFSEKRLLKWEPPFIVQPKYDGFRCRAVPLTDGNYLLLSSEEHPFYSVPHINEALDKSNLNVELDGELYSHDLDFNQLSSIISRTTNLHQDYKSIEFHIFDIVTNQPQSVRISEIYRLPQIPYTKISPFWVCESLEDIMKIYDYLIASNYEGIIVRHFMAPYERKRSLYMMKFKPTKEDMYRIRWFQEELTKDGVPKGRLGALICESGDGENFSVGTGFTNEQRESLWKIKASLPGKFVRIQYQHLTPGKNFPRFPVFVEILERRKSYE